jgi:hypothetical protein
MKRLGKKSQHEIMFIVFQLLMIAAVFASLMFFVSSLKNQTFFRKLAISRDLALLTNILYAAPGNIDYTYHAANLNLSEFEYSFEDQLVKVIEAGRETAYPYGDDSLFRLISARIREPERFYFQNNDYIFSAREEREISQNFLKYPYVEAGERGNLMVGFYPPENPLANQIAAELRAGKEGVGRITDANTLIIAEIDDETSRTLRIEIPSNPEFIKQNRKLASLIMNNALERGNIDYALIVPAARAELNIANTSVFISLSEDVPIIDISQTISRALSQYG